MSAGLRGTILIPLVIASILCAPSGEAESRRGTYAADTSGGTIPGRLVVKVAPGVGDPLQSIRSALAMVGATAGPKGIRAVVPLSLPRERTSPRGIISSALDRIYMVEAALHADVSSALQRIASHADIEYVEPLYYHRVKDIPADPQIRNQIGVMKRLQMYPAWDVGKGDRNVAIAIIDGGTFWRHEDLWANLWSNQPEDLNHNGLFDPGPPPAGDEDGFDQDANGFIDDVIGWNFTSGSGDPDGMAASPQNRSHGTATAGAACAVTDNAVGMAGTSWNCSLLPVCAAARQGDNLIEFGYEGILYAALRGARIINCSWRRRGPYSQFEQDVIDAVTSSGSLVIAAAGNDSEDHDVLPSYPGGYTGVLAVGATNTSSDVLASFSNYGATVPVYAPGVVIVGPTTEGGYLKGFAGTSFSAPLVAGVAGLLASQHPEWYPAQIAGQLRMTADPIDDENPALQGRLGKGRVNAFRALTESHAVIALKHASAEKRDSTGRRIFLPGDTVVVSLKLENVSDVWDNGWDLDIRAGSGDPVLRPLVDRQIVKFPAPGESIDVSYFLFRVGQVTATRAVSIRIEWGWSGGELDRHAIPVTVFPSSPTWVDQQSPVPATFFSVRAVSHLVAWAAGIGPGGGPVVVRTTDGGLIWTGVTGDLSGEELYCVSALGEDRAWVGTGSGRIFGTTDGGTTWKNLPYPEPASPFMNGVWFVDEANGYALGDPPPGDSRFVILHTSDGGQTWAHLPQEPVGDAGETGLNNSCWWTDARHGWFGTTGGKVWRTSDGGATWQWSRSGAGVSLGVAFTDHENGLAVHADGTVSRTSDGGATWGNAALSPSRLVSVSMVRSSPLAWISSDAASFSSTNRGETWRTEVTYPIRGSIHHLSFADSLTGWAVTSAGAILRYATSPLTDAGEEVAGLRMQIFLEQNYPNPFNPATTIMFTIPSFVREDGNVRLVVYDLLGRQVKVLVDERRAPGSYEVAFDARNLASGMYMYRLTAGTFVETKKMVVTK